MSEQREHPNGDEQAFEAYLRGESPVSRQYKQDHASDAPPAELDARVLELASVAAGPSRARPKWLQWSGPIALAASVLVVVALAIRPDMRQQAAVTAAQPMLEQASERRSAAESARVREEAGGSANENAGSLDEPDLVKQEAARAASQRPVAPRGEVPPAAVEFEVYAPPQSAPEAPPAPAEPPAVSRAEEDEVAAAAAEAKSRAPSAAAPAAQSAQSAQSAPSAPSAPSARRSAGALESVTATSAVSDAIAPSPQAWLERIRKQRDDGDIEGAREEWRRFREAYPTYVVESPPFEEFGRDER